MGHVVNRFWTTSRLRIAVAELLATLLYIPHATNVVSAPFDAWTHLFISSHYLLDWWAPIDNRWYLGMEVTTYPPFAHQFLAVIARPLTTVVPLPVALEAAYVFATFLIVLTYPVAIYAFAGTLVEDGAAALAAVAGVLFSGWWMLLYGYGQFPTLIALLFTLFGARCLDRYLTTGTHLAGVLTVALTALVAMTHHFSTLSVLPAVYGIVVLAHLWVDERGPRRVLARCAAVAIPAVGIVLVALWPFVRFTLSGASLPVIPHGSRTPLYYGNPIGRPQFWHVLFAGGLFLTLVPLVARNVWGRRKLAAPIALASVFGLLSLGYTTPLPRLIYWSLAEQLTYYRFAAWGGVLLLPALGLTLERSLEHPFRAGALVLVVVFGLQGLIATQMTENRYIQDNLEGHEQVEASAEFIERGDNAQWRYLTLGMAREMGGVGIHAPGAQTIDGSYHRARNPEKLPELVEAGAPQLANAKFDRWGRDGKEGNSLGVLEFYLEHNDEYHVKYVFSDDPFYDSILRKHGFELVERWPRLDVRVWEDPETPPMPESQRRNPTEGFSPFMYPWGTVPLLTFVGAIGVATYAGVKRRSGG